MVGVALLLAFKGKDIYHAYADRRSVSTAAEALKLVEDEHYEKASQMLQDGFRLTPDSIPLSRVIAELFFRGYNDPSTAISFLRKVLNSPEGTATDRLRLAEILLASGEIAEARRFYAALPPAEQTGRRGLELLAGIKQQGHERIEAEGLLRRALTLAPDDLDAQLKLAVLDENSALEQAKGTATEKIWALARRQDDVALKAMAHLAQGGSLKAAQARELKALIEKHPEADDKQRYMILRTFLRLNPLEHQATVQAELERAKKRSVEDSFDFLRWLGVEGEYDLLIKAIPADAVTRDADIFLIYVDALTAAERWKELLALMQSPRRPPVTPATVHLIQAQCYSKLKPDLILARKELALILDAGGKPELPVLARAASLAESLHMYDLAVQGLKVLAQTRPAVRIQMLEKIYDLQQGLRNAEGMADALRQLHELRPENTIYTSRLNYLRLVSGMELEPAYEELLGTGPESTTKAAADPASTDVPLPLLRALAALRFGDMDAVKREVTTLPNPDAWQPGHRAVAAGLYTLCGRDVEGYRLAEKIPATLLIDGERKFLRRSLR